MCIDTVQAEMKRPEQQPDEELERLSKEKYSEYENRRRGIIMNTWELEEDHRGQQILEGFMCDICSNLRDEDHVTLLTIFSL